MKKEILTRICTFGRRLAADRLAAGTGGNLSCRDPQSGEIAITPSGIPYPELTPEAVSVIDGRGRRRAGEKPSSEWQLHLEVYRRRPEVNAVVHTHSPYATTFAVLRQPLPPCHYLLAFAGADTVRVAPYATFGTLELAVGTAAALGSDNCILMANHGLLAVGHDLEAAYLAALHVEEVARLYYQARCLGEPACLDEGEMAAARERFRRYGRRG